MLALAPVPITPEKTRQVQTEAAREYNSQISRNAKQTRVTEDNLDRWRPAPTHMAKRRRKQLVQKIENLREDCTRKRTKKHDTEL